MNKKKLATEPTARPFSTGKRVLFESDKIPQILRRLAALGFRHQAGGNYVKPSPTGNIQGVVLTHDRIEPECIWLLVTRRKPFTYADQAAERFAQRRQAKLESRLQLAKAYWRRVHPFIKDRYLMGAELYVAQDAFYRLKDALDKVDRWNRSEEGQRHPVKDESIVELGTGEFREPERLCRDENLKPGSLTAIARRGQQAQLTPAQEIQLANELRLAEQRYIESLPQAKQGMDRTLDDFDQAMDFVTFTQIKDSNARTSVRLPLLPPVGQKRKGRSVQELLAGPLTIVSIKNAVRIFLKNRIPRLTKEEYEREQQQTQRLVEAGVLLRTGGSEPETYLEWQSNNQKTVDDCMQNNRISLQDLCALRWQRFEKSYQDQQSRVHNRKLKKSMLKSVLPRSAASTQVYSGKPERGKTASMD